MWQTDCDNFRRAGSPFELRDITTEEHRRFAQLFAQDHGLRMTERGTSVLFERA